MATACAWLVGLGPPVAAQTAPRSAARTVTTPQATVELISASDRPKAGETLWLGLRFRLAEGWHIYWVNPGDSGGPPSLSWNVPPGFEVGGFVWPVPHRLPFGTLVNYGYEGDVTLPVPVQVPAGYRGGSVTLGGRARWLACKELCVSQRGDLAITLPLQGADSEARLQWAERIEAGRQAEPRPAPASWRARVTSARDHFTLRVTLDRTAGPAYFFPLDESQVNDSAKQEATANGRQLVIVLKKSAQLVEDPARLRGVLSFGPGRAHVIDAPVSAAR
ncbi:MAG: hypothetical protein KJ061_12690 [Vicinamibacteraceae bacterium]|nr:hypothetical protein [Vicinamibacteraceae bacterium]